MFTGDIFSKFANYITFNFLSLEKWTHLAYTLNFFITDILKIFFLLIIITHLMSFIRYYLPIEKIRILLIKNNLYWLDYFFWSLFWALTPFCSCSSIPLFIWFLESRIPLWITFAFLITSPLINEAAIALFLWIFWFKVTVIYMISWILIWIIGGFIIWKLKMEQYVEDFVWKIKAKNKIKAKKTNITFIKLFKKISFEAFSIIKKIWIYIIFWVWLGSIIHGFIPQNFFVSYLNKLWPFWVPLAVIIAIPMYSNASGTIPIIQSLVEKGVPLWTSLAFMMAIVWLSAPEALMLKKVMKWQLLFTFFWIVTIWIIIIGYVFNLFF